MMKNLNKQKNIQILILLLLVSLAFIMPTPVLAQSGDGDDQIVLGGTFRLRSNETIAGDLIVLGGAAYLEQDSRVKGNVIVAGGTLEVSGTIDENITAFGGTIKLMDDAVVKGDVILSSTTFSQEPGAEVRGDIENKVIDFDSFEFDNLPQVVVSEPDYTAPFRMWIDFLTGAIWWVLRILAVAGMGALLVMVAQKPTERVAQSISNQPVITFAFGLLTLLVSFFLTLILTVTIILIPVAVIGILVLALAALFGWIAVGYEIGRQLRKALKQTWAPVITAGLGTFILSFIASIFSLVPCIGVIVPILVTITGLGGVLVSRFGTQVYESNANPSGPATMIDAEARDSDPFSEQS